MIELSDIVQVRKDTPSGTVLINRPEKRNALSREIVSMLAQAFEDLHQERDVRGVILTGAGETFCSGTDLAELHQTASQKDAMQVWHQDAESFRGLIEQMLRFPKPIICAVNGPVVGSGLALMLACDVVVASDKAAVSIPESLRGLSPGLNVPLLSYRIGSGLASKLLFSGQPSDAVYVKEIGLFHEVVSEDFVWAKSHEMVTRIAATARESHQMTKQFLVESIGESLLTQLTIAAANMAAARTTPAASEGVAAFLEKRDPDWNRLAES